MDVDPPNDLVVLMDYLQRVYGHDFWIEGVVYRSQYSDPDWACFGCCLCYFHGVLSRFYHDYLIQEVSCSDRACLVVFEQLGLLHCYYLSSWKSRCKFRWCCCPRSCLAWPAI